MERKPMGSTRFPCAARRLHRLARGLLFFLLFALAAGVVRAQEQPAAPEPRLEIASIELGDFPIIGLNLIATNANSERRTELQGLRLWENGVPIADYTLEPVSPGVDLFLLLDIDEGWGENLGAGQTPLATVQESVLRLAGRYLEAGRDRVWLGMTVGAESRWLVEESGEPGEMVSALGTVRAPAGSAGDPARALALALDAVEDGGETGRFTAIVLFTTGTGLSTTSLLPLVQQARAAQVVLSVVLVGAAPGMTVAETLETAALSTRGAVYPLSDAAAVDGLYELLAANAVQTQVRYRTNLQEDGEYPVRVVLGEREGHATLRLAFRPPQVTIVLDGGREIRRAGLAPDSALAQLQPAVQTVPVELAWPDGVPRRLQGATLLVDGVAQPAPVLGGATVLEFEWDIADLSEGSYALTVLVTDSVGLSAESPPLLVTVAEVRPAPSPTAVPPAVPPPAAVATRPLSPLLVGLGGALILLIGLVLLWRVRRSTQGARASGTGPVRGQPFLVLESGERWAIVGELTVGRQGADILLDGEGMTVLHARLACEEDGCWLYDEGSSAGTFVNGQRLGLEGRRLYPGDEMRFGAVVAQFVVERAVKR
ncbi:MAG: FHA domain-containing protein [Anaerolineae bacterium]|nr:FHA domain-containing protein [Anaerolineae bacterium]